MQDLRARPIVAVCRFGVHHHAYHAHLHPALHPAHRHPARRLGLGRQLRPTSEGFAYPHQIQRYSFASQGLNLQMAYMDVAPAGAANGKTAVLLHGKNFCGATWSKPSPS
jgi:hypothetical protein